MLRDERYDPGSNGAGAERGGKAGGGRLGIASVADLAEPRLRDQVLALLPQARSVVTLAMEVYPEVLDHSRPGKLIGEGSPSDMLGPHMDYMNSRLTKAAYDVARSCRKQGLKALPMPAANYPD